MKDMREYVARMRHKLHLDKLPASVRKTLVTIVGGACLAAGVVMIVMPGPAFIFIPLGLLLLASEFKWAERAADKIIDGIEAVQRRWHERKRRRAGAQ